MRDTSKWRGSLKAIRDRIKERATELNFTTFCDIELGLYLLSQLDSDAPAIALWVLLTGYPFPVASAENWSEKQHRMLGNARHILTQFRSKYSWERSLQRYRQVDEILRRFNVDENLEKFTFREVSICSNRDRIYAQTLEQALPHRKNSIKWAPAGKYECSDGKYRVTVDLAEELVFPPPSGHDLNLKGRNQRQTITVTWEDLLETAQWMDTQSDGKWEERLSRVRLDLFGSDFSRSVDTLTRAEKLTFNGLMHLIGMVSSGKSTLMDILAVWAAKHELHITIVVGDVISALNRARLFDRLGIPVAPMLGASNRDRHTNRLHRAWNAEHPLEKFNQEHVGFRWLSTACPLSELRRDVAKPFSAGKQPCLALSGISESDDEDREQKQPDTSKTYACPIYSACPFHQVQRDLVNAKIWIATPASLIYSRVAPQINQESIRFSELLYRRSDLVIVDEADQVQVQLDSLFSPGEKLFGQKGDGWFSKVQQPVVQQLNQGGRGQLIDPDVDRWCKAHDMVQTATSRIYALVLSQPQPALSEWIDQREYFTDWLILDKLAIALSGAREKTRDKHQGYRRLMEEFNNYIGDPLGDRAAPTISDRSNNPLCELTRQAIALIDDDLLRLRLGEWIDRNKEPDVTLTKERREHAIVQMEFALLVAVLQNRLNLMLRDWKHVEAPLKLQEQSSMLFYSPPRDYEGIIPVAPMGNVLAFQYLSSSDSGPGDLRFFKCMGVGRWFLLHLHELFASDGIAGPSVLLLSGTSWAGKAPGYHVQVPVAGVLRSPEEELQAIKESYFEFSPFYDRENNPITVSGSHDREGALKELLNQLAKPGDLGGPSRLEQKRDELEVGRQRILLLVGSYDQAKLAQTHLENIRPEWRGQVLRLVRDDDEFGTQWSNNNQGIQRGLVHQFASTDAWILIAPLMAIERGHNILNDEDKAALGAAYFLVRPHPRPDDISYAIHSINRWAIEHYADTEWLTDQCSDGQDGLLTLDRVGEKFREKAYYRWRHLMSLPMIYSSLPEKDREAVTWNQLVSIWQAIGRLIRGGCQAEVFFCDAAFARRTAFNDDLGDEPITSLLVSIKEVLRPYFATDSDREIAPRERELVQALYRPFYTAIEKIGGMNAEL